MKRPSDFASEADLVAGFCAYIEKNWNNRNTPERWVIYHETAGWDVLLAEESTGVQIGIEAKLSLNAKAIEQALVGAGDSRYAASPGPDYRAVLVPANACQAHLTTICRHIGLTLLKLRDFNAGSGREWREKYGPRWQVTFAGHGPPEEDGGQFGPSLTGWFPWLPEKRHKLPDYIPDVSGGKASPVALTEWKIRAIKLLILLDRNGFVTRSDMRAIDISPTRWTAAGGFLKPDTELGGYVRHHRTPDLRAQHPVNYAQIEADFEKWCPPGRLLEVKEKERLL